MKSALKTKRNRGERKNGKTFTTIVGDSMV